MENNKILKNVHKIMALFKIIPYEYNDSAFSRICLSFTVFYLTDFEYKLNIDNNNYFELLGLTNKFLENLNSKFLIHDEMNEIEYINFIIFLFAEFDIINDYIDYIKILEKKNITISLDKLLNLNKQYITSQDNFDTNNILTAFNRLNFIFKNTKKQVDLFINLSIKLNQLKEVQEKPNK
jgi:hypothetical protein